MTLRASSAIVVALTLSGLAAGIACNPEERRDADPAAVAVSQALTPNVDLVTPTNCKLRGQAGDPNARLVECAIATQVLSGQQLETAVPMRTVLTAVRSGTCAGQPYALEVSLETPGEPAVPFRFLSQPSATVRRRDGLPVPYITLKDALPTSTSRAWFKSDCRIALSVSSNEVDVDTKEQAEAIVARLTQDVANKTRIRDRYADLVEYHAAFEFLDGIVTYFHTELTAPALQKLRADGHSAKPVIMKMVTEDACSGQLADDELNAIVSLYEGLAVLGSPESWQTDGGGTKTLADFLGSEGAHAVEVARRLAARNGADAGPGYKEEYRIAAREVEGAEAKLALAKAQLARWLSP